MLKLRELREERNLVQKELAEMLNKTRACISSWETGKTEPDLDSLVRIADILQVSTDELLDRVNNTGKVEISTQLSADQTELLYLYGQLSERKKNQLLGFIKGLNF